MINAAYLILIPLMHITISPGKTKIYKSAQLEFRVKYLKARVTFCIFPHHFHVGSAL